MIQEIINSIGITKQELEMFKKVREKALNEVKKLGYAGGVTCVVLDLNIIFFIIFWKMFITQKNLLSIINILTILQ